MKLVGIRLMEMYNEVRVLEAELAVKKKILDGLKNDMLIEMDTAGTSTYRSPLGLVTLMTSELPVINDWPALCQQILEEGSLDLLEKRVSRTAWRDRIEAGVQVHGVYGFEKKSLRITAN